MALLLSLLVVAAAVSGAWVAVAVAAVTMLLCSVCVCAGAGWRSCVRVARRCVHGWCVVVAVGGWGGGVVGGRVEAFRVVRSRDCVARVLTAVGFELVPLQTGAWSQRQSCCVLPDGVGVAASAYGVDGGGGGGGGRGWQ